jgi:hypothetical protein
MVMMSQLRKTPDSSIRSLRQSYQQIHLGAIRSREDEGVRILYISICDMSTDLKYAVISYDIGPLALLPTRRKMCCGFLSPLEIHRLQTVEWGGRVV